jgi:small subunit ribosomal protein S20
MANHKSALKRIRQNENKKVHNKFYAKTMRNALRDFRGLTEKKDLEERFPKLTSLIDKLVKKNLIHKNKAANLKSKMAKQVSSI